MVISSSLTHVSTLVVRSLPRIFRRASRQSCAVGRWLLVAGLLGVTIAPAHALEPDDEQQLQVGQSLLAEYSEQATLQKAEANYRARRLDAAMEQFGMIAAMDNHPFAWLRIGNICHRRGDVSGAFDAYQRARASASGAERFAELQARAVMNLALLGLDQAQVALEDLGLPDRQRASGRWVDEVRLRLDELAGTLTEPQAGGGGNIAAPMLLSPTASNQSALALSPAPMSVPAVAR